MLLAPTILRKKDLREHFPWASDITVEQPPAFNEDARGHLLRQQLTPKPLALIFDELRVRMCCGENQSSLKSCTFTHLQLYVLLLY